MGEELKKGVENNRQTINELKEEIMALKVVIEEIEAYIKLLKEGVWG